MSTRHAQLAGLRTRWSAIGAAVAITLGAGGIGLAQAAIEDGDKPVTITVAPERILDTRDNLGLTGAFASETPRDLQVTGDVDVASGAAKKTVVPAGASAVLVNVTAVNPSGDGFLSLRPAGATGAPSTSTVNFGPGTVEPNAATVDLSADGKIQIYAFIVGAAPSVQVLVDVVGYTIDHNHNDLYYTEAEVDAAVAAAVAPKANSADVYTKTEIDATNLWAVVSSTGTLARSANATSASQIGTGEYEVIFNRDVTACVYVAVAGNVGGGNPPARFVVTASRAGSANGVFFEVYDEAGTNVDMSFHVIVQC